MKKLTSIEAIQVYGGGAEHLHHRYNFSYVVRGTLDGILLGAAFGALFFKGDFLTGAALGAVVGVSYTSISFVADELDRYLGLDTPNSFVVVAPQ